MLFGRDGPTVSFRNSDSDTGSVHAAGVSVHAVACGAGRVAASAAADVVAVAADAGASGVVACSVAGAVSAVSVAVGVVAIVSGAGVDFGGAASVSIVTFCGEAEAFPAIVAAVVAYSSLARETGILST